MLRRRTCYLSVRHPKPVDALGIDEMEMDVTAFSGIDALHECAIHVLPAGLYGYALDASLPFLRVRLLGRDACAPVAEKSTSGDGVRYARLLPVKRPSFFAFREIPVAHEVDLRMQEIGEQFRGLAIGLLPFTVGLVGRYLARLHSFARLHRNGRRACAGRFHVQVVGADVSRRHIRRKSVDVADTRARHPFPVEHDASDGIARRMEDLHGRNRHQRLFDRRIPRIAYAHRHAVFPTARLGPRGIFAVCAKIPPFKLADAHVSGGNLPLRLVGPLVRKSPGVRVARIEPVARHFARRGRNGQDEASWRHDGVFKLGAA